MPQRSVQRARGLALVIALVLLVLALPAGASAAGGGGVLRITHREQLRACTYAARHAGTRQRRRACARVARLRLPLLLGRRLSPRLRDGYATATSPLGASSTNPFTKAAANPVLKQTASVLSPGGGSFTIGPHGGNWLLYHGRAGDYSQPRLRTDPVYWSSAGAVTVRGPTTGPETPVP